jgi:hypothetical protein
LAGASNVIDLYPFIITPRFFLSPILPPKPSLKMTFFSFFSLFFDLAPVRCAHGSDGAAQQRRRSVALAFSYTLHFS